MREQILKALRKHAEAHIEKHRMNVEIFMETPVGVADHGGLMDTIEAEIMEMAKYQDVLDIIDKQFK